MTDFLVTREAVVARHTCKEGLEWAAPFLPCRFTELVQRAKTHAEIGYCIWALRLDTGPDADKRIVRFALLCSRSIEHPAVGCPAVKACNDLVQRWLDGERVSYPQFQEAAHAASLAARAADAGYGPVYAAAHAATIAVYAAAHAVYAAHAAVDASNATYASYAVDAANSIGASDDRKKFLLELYT